MEPENRDASGRFKAGVSGNPGGRPVEAEQVRELARQHAPEAITRLVEHMRGLDARVSLSACCALLDRGFGKPVQEIAGQAGATAFTLTAPWWAGVLAARGTTSENNSKQQ